MKGKLLMVLIPLLLLVSLVGCNRGPIQYVNKEFGYIISYPRDWIFIELNENVIVIKPEPKTKNQIQVGAFPNQNGVMSVPEAQTADMLEQLLKETFDTLGHNILEITGNEPASNKWDWKVTFEVYLNGLVLEGVYYIKESPSLVYTLFLLTEDNWPEAPSVLESFYFIET